MSTPRSSVFSSIFSRLASRVTTGLRGFGRRAAMSSTAGSLATRAGSVLESHQLEQLEARQLLFTWTIGVTADDGPGGQTRVQNLGNGLFRISADIAYVLPFLSAVQPDAVEPPALRYAAFTDTRVLGARFTFTGRVGAQLVVEDVYRRDFRNTIFGRIPPQLPGATVPPRAAIDLNDDGIPDYNEGIGRITLSGTDQDTSLTIVGSVIPRVTGTNPAQPPIATDYQSRTQFGVFQAASVGFGYALDTSTGTPVITGLPTGTPGTVVIGSPYVRDVTNAASYFNQLNDGTVTDGRRPIPLNFNNPNQGIRVIGGASVGSITIDGVLHGNSTFSGAVGSLNVNVLLGSVQVNGDLGRLSVAGDAGVWVSPSTSALNPATAFTTNSSVVVGRTAQSIVIGARNALSISVLGDTNSARARLNPSQYFSSEVVLGISPGVTTNVPAFFLNELSFGFQQNGSQFRTLGNSVLRNDSIASAEFIGNSTTRTTVNATIQGLDPINTRGDDTDVYAFAADPTREIVINPGATNLLYRIVDDQGRVLASNGAVAGPGRGADGVNNNAFVLRYRPQYTGVYFVVVNSLNPNPDTIIGTQSYAFSIDGMAPVTLGELRAGLGTGALTESIATSLNIGSGAVGLYRNGTGYFSPTSGGDSSSVSLTNTSLDVGELQRFDGATLTIPATLYGLFIGGDIGARLGFFASPRISIGGDLGIFITGNSPSLSGSAETGDIVNLSLDVGGKISLLRARGGVGVDVITGAGDVLGGIVTIRTGLTPGLNGSIGQFLIGQYLVGPALTIITPVGSQIDQIIVGSAPTGEAEFPREIRNGAPTIITGAGSDVRFFVFDTISGAGSADEIITLSYNQPYTFVDDAGARFTIRITGGDASIPGDTTGINPRSQSTATLRQIGIDGSQGVALADIQVNLRGGANLVISGDTAGVASIGRIRVDASYTDASTIGPATASVSSILISGITQIDVYRIDVSRGALDQINNTSTNGDFVAIDAARLNSLSIRTGSLGRTETGPATRVLLGPFLGINGTRTGKETTLGAPLGIRSATVDSTTGIGNQSISAAWSGATFAPVTRPGQNFSLETIGSPIDPYLNGLRVRAGNLNTVTVGGAVGDVLLEDTYVTTIVTTPTNGTSIVITSGRIGQVTANANQTLETLDDGRTSRYGLEGIVGSIYASVIDTVNVGSGLAGSGSSALATAGIFADEFGIGEQGQPVPSIRLVQGGGPSGVRGAVIQGLIIGVQGIGTISLTDGQFSRASIGATRLDDWWISTNVVDTRFDSGNIALVEGVRSNLFGSILQGFSLTEVRLTEGGTWDANEARFNRSINVIRAANFTNSSLFSDSTERLVNTIIVGGNIATVETNNTTVGDIRDLVIDATGSITDGVRARIIERTLFQVNNVITEISATRDIRGLRVVAGQLTALTAGANIRTTTLDVAGPILSVSATNEITGLLVNSTGPDSRVGSIVATNLLQGSITSAGNIERIESTNGDVRADIVTRDDLLRNNRGNLTTLQAGRSYIGRLIITGNVETISLGQNAGVRGQANNVLDIRGDLGSITVGSAASAGAVPVGNQIYADLIVGGNVTGTITIGRVSTFVPDQDLVSSAAILVFGHINALVASGDLGNSITSRSGGIGTISITNGSLRRSAVITTTAGGLGTLTITGGDLLANILIDGNIGTISLVNGADGFVGSIGVAPNKSAGVRWLSDNRNTLPPGIAPTSGNDGVLIKARGNIGRVTTAGAAGGIFESRIVSGDTITAVTVGGDFRNDNLTSGNLNAIVARNAVTGITIGGAARGLSVIAGVISLGADEAVGGTGANADSVGAGTIGTVGITRRVGFSQFVAGIAPDVFGAYVSGLATQSGGISSIGTITAGSVGANVSAFTSGSLAATSAGIFRGGSTAGATNPSTVATFDPADVRVSSGVDFAFQTASGQAGTLRYAAASTGPNSGRIAWNPVLRRFRIIGTIDSITIGAAGGVLTDLLVRSNVGASVGTITVTAALRGNSSIFVDRAITTLTLAEVDSTGIFGSSGNIGTINIGTSSSSRNFTAGVLRAQNVNTLAITGNFGRTSAGTNASALFDSVGTITIGGVHAGSISSERTITSYRAASVSGGGLRSGQSISSITVTNSTDAARFSARVSIGTVSIAGSASLTSILGGLDLGTDAQFGGAGSAADQLFNGTIGNVTVGGNFVRSDIAAGVAPGASGFLGFPDQQVAPGRASIGNVTIGGNTVGSTANSQQYRIISTGSVGAVTVSGLPFAQRGNFVVTALDSVAAPVVVTAYGVEESSRIYSVSITLNQALDQSSLATGIRIQQVRGNGTSLLTLVNGTDYSIAYDETRFQVRITFSTAVTRRDLPAGNTQSSPGVFRVTLDANIIRGSARETRVDGDNNGIAGDNWVRNLVIGDTGDRISSVRVSGIDFYEAADLNQILQTTAGANLSPRTNTVFNIDGVLGDHPDTDITSFRGGSDIDLYRITLSAGQILRVGALTGSARAGVYVLFDSAGNPVTDQFISLPADGLGGFNSLTQTSGTYYLALVARNPLTPFGPFPIRAGADVPNVDIVPSAFGSYRFTIEVFDDGDNGFLGGTASSTSNAIITPVRPFAFLGADGVLGTSDDLTRVLVPDATGDVWTFTYTVPTNGNLRSAGTVITGINSRGWTVTRVIGSERNGSRDTLSSSIRAAIGTPNLVGAPQQIQPDLDIYRLNNGDVIAPGTRYRVTLRLNSTGANLGLPTTFSTRNSTEGGAIALPDFTPQTQFALFEVPTGAGFGGGRLVASPTDFLSVGGRTSNASGDQIVARDTTEDGPQTSYGYDAQGDFYLEFRVPPAQGTDSTAAIYALYIQGAIQSDYVLEITQLTSAPTVVTSTQNILIETRGGSVSWLENDEAQTQLSAFTSSVVGFGGQIAGLPVDSYIVQQLVARLTTLFTNAGVRFNISTNANDFAGQSFSTVYLAGNNPPNSLLGIGALSLSEHSDAFNADKSDEAVVFVPTYSVFNFGGDQAGVDQFVNAISASVGQRIGELVGLRYEEADFFNVPIPIQGFLTPNLAIGVSGFDTAFVDQSRELLRSASVTTTLASLISGTDAFFQSPTKTGFFLGQQNSFQLLRSLVLRI